MLALAAVMAAITLALRPVVVVVVGVLHQAVPLVRQACPRRGIVEATPAELLARMALAVEVGRGQTAVMPRPPPAEPVEQGRPIASRDPLLHAQVVVVAAGAIAAARVGLEEVAAAALGPMGGHRLSARLARQTVAVVVVVALATVVLVVPASSSSSSDKEN